MPYNPLHHKYRPQTFAQLVGQDAIATTLTNAVHTERIAPAYMFTGPRGTGKTSSARILAKSLNCLSSNQPISTPCGRCEVCLGINKGSALDVIEIDAASNTGVDNIREVIERAQFAPVQCRYKLYIIDEAHMLSSAAFNALLKTLEEPPNRVVFILATTDPQRVLPTIISRCQRFDFRPIPLEPMLAHLSKIAQQESINITPEAITLVAQIANGGLRDAQSLLDQLSLLPDTITPEKVWDLVGAVPEQDLLAMLQAIRSNNSATIIELCRNLMNRGKEPVVVLQNLAGFYLNLLIAKTSPQNSAMVAVTGATWEELTAEADHWDVSIILQGQQHLKTSEAQIKKSTQSRLWLEITLLGLLPAATAGVAMPKPEINSPAPILASVTPAQELRVHKEEQEQAAVTQVNKVDKETAKKLITDIYTDGSCIGNPGFGGWAFVAYFEDGDRHEKGHGVVPNTTNNRMEIQAAIAALKYLADSGQTELITLHTDSEYVLKGVSKWVKIWQKNGWKTRQNTPVSNQDLWEKLDQLNSDLVTWKYVEGHSGNEGNERCDTIARAFAKGEKLILNEPPELLSPPPKTKPNSSPPLAENVELSHTNSSQQKEENPVTLSPNQVNQENRKIPEQLESKISNYKQSSTADLNENSKNISVSKEEKTTAAAQASAIIANQIPSNIIWKQVLDNLQPQTSRVLLSQHCTLLHYDGSVAYIKVASTALLKHAQPRKTNIEDAFERVSQKKITVNLQVSDTIPNHTQLVSLKPLPMEEEMGELGDGDKNRDEDNFISSPEVVPMESASSDLSTTDTEITNSIPTENLVIPSQEETEEEGEKEVEEDNFFPSPENVTAPEDEQTDSEETFSAAQSLAQMFKGEVITLEKEFNYVEPELQRQSNSADDSLAEEPEQEENDPNDIPF